MSVGKKNKEDRSLCDINHAIHSSKKLNRTTFYKHRGGFRWMGIKKLPYKTKGDEWSDITRMVMIGSQGESTKFHIRYFEIDPEGYSSLEKHRHEHVVICIRGSGLVRTGNTKRKMNFLDTIYIAPNTPHQLTNPYKQTFGFLCIVNAKRDRPKLLKE
jgi:ribulose-bisphosphate carboxylase large chain